MKSFCFFLLGIILLFMVSCSSGQSTRSNDYGDAIQLKVVNADNPIEIVKLTDLVDSVEYIPLETTDECLLGNIYNIKEDAGIFFIWVREGLYAFSSDGKFLNRIGRKGDAPGEYIYMNCFYLDTFNKRVGIACELQHKIFLYTYDGVFHSCLELRDTENSIHNIEMIGENKLLIHKNLYSDIDKCENEYLVYDYSKGSTPLVSVLKKSPHVTTTICAMSYIHRPISHWGRKTWFIPTFGNVIYTCDGQEAVPSYYIDIPNLALNNPSFKREERWDCIGLYGPNEFEDFINNNNLSRGITGLGTCSDYLILQKDLTTTFIWDGNKGVALSGVYHEERNLFSLAFLQLSSHIQYCEAASYYGMKERGIEPQTRSLKKVLENVSEEDNPILSRYYLKNNLVESLCQQYGL